MKMISGGAADSQSRRHRRRCFDGLVQMRLFSRFVVFQGFAARLIFLPLRGVRIRRGPARAARSFAPVGAGRRRLLEVVDFRGAADLQSCLHRRLLECVVP
jgi:hypothetical protein